VTSFPGQDSARLQISRLPAKHPSDQDIRDGREIDEQRTQVVDEPIPGPARYRTSFSRQPDLAVGGDDSLGVTNPVYVTAP